MFQRLSLGGVAALALATGLATVAAATPPQGFAIFPVANAKFGPIDEHTAGQKTDKWSMLLKTKERSDVGADRVTLEPGGTSGWHSHQSPVFLIVTKGSIDWIYSSLCSPRRLNVGDGVIEHAFRPHTSSNPAAPGGEVAETIAVRIKPASVIGPAFRINEQEPSNCN